MQTEILESRQLLSISFTDGFIVVRGTEGDDVVIVSFNETGSRVVVKLNTSTRRYNTADVRGIGLFGRGGNDYLALADNVPISATIHGEAGYDTLVGGAAKDWEFGG